MTTFHDAPPPWFEAVKDLKPGGKRRLGDGFLVSFNGRAYMRYDFREKEAEVYEPQITLAQRVAIQKAMREAEESVIQSLEFPSPTMSHPQDWPVEARVWLHKAHLNNNDISIMGAVWSPTMQRVVIPLDMLDGSKGWIARDVAVGNGGRAGTPLKYLFPKAMRRGGGAVLRNGQQRVAVVTEDILSSQRIWNNGYTTVSALGTSLDREAVVRMADEFDTVLFWLDPDYYGQLGARRIRKDISRLGVRTGNILSEFDPKLHSDGEIEIYIDNALSEAR